MVGEEKFSRRFVAICKILTDRRKFWFVYISGTQRQVFRNGESSSERLKKNWKNKNK